MNSIPEATRWLELAQAGDPTAFESLYLWLEPDVARFVRRLMRDDPASDDIVQETFLTLYIHLAEIDPPAKLRPYVFRVARNACYDVMRQWGRRPGVSIDDDGAEDRVAFNLRDDAAAPEEVAHWLLMGMEVRGAIDRLPELQRQTLILFCEEDMSHAEIADIMDVSIGTVKSRLFHAKKTLRGMVQPELLLAIQADSQPKPERTEQEAEMAAGG